MMRFLDATDAWLLLLDDIFQQGKMASPRSQRTKEIPQHTITMDMRRPVLQVPSRHLNYQFMAAEAFWIVTGDNRVATIAPYNKNIEAFSDDGQVFFGAYGPSINGQMRYVVDKLIEDPDTRQAGLTLWRQNPPVSKDIPCTVAMWFQLRGGVLNCHVFMRSSDAWLGVPYDVFNFSMVAHLVCSLLNVGQSPKIQPGVLYLTMASSHLYERHWEAAKACLDFHLGVTLRETMQPDVPELYFASPHQLIAALGFLKDTKPGHPARWWEVKP